MMLSGVIGTPGGAGGATLGLGVVLKLHDAFSKQAIRIDRQMKMLENRTDRFTKNMDLGLHMMSAGLGTIAVGAGVLGTLAFPLRDAINFQDAVQNTFAIVDEKSGILKEDIANVGKRLGSLFPQNATEMVRSLKTTIAAGVDDINSAEYIVEFATKLALPTDSNVNDVTSGMLSMLLSYGYLDETLYTTEQIKENVKMTADYMFEASKMARFSDTEVSDLAALAKQLGQITPIAGQIGIGAKELLALGATGTRTGQNARRLITGLRQSFMDILNAQRGENRWNKGFVDYARRQGVELYNQAGQLDPISYIRANSFTDFLKLVKGYAGLDPDQVTAALSNKDIAEKINILQENISAGLIKETDRIEDVAGGNELIKALQDKIGVVNVHKVKEIFPSVWGLTAVLPLIGSQFEFLEKAMARMDDARGATEKAYKEAMQTVKMQWALLTSQLQTLGIVWGSHLLKPVQRTISSLNQLVGVLISVSHHLGWLISPLLTAASYLGMFLAALGSALALRGGLIALNNFILKNAADSGILSRFLGGSLSAAIWRATWLTLGLVGAQALLSAMWKNNFMGMADKITWWKERVTAVVEAVQEIFRNLDWSTGLSELSGETVAELERLGVDQITYKLAAVLFRFAMFLHGVASGFTNTMRHFKLAFESVVKGVVDTLETLDILPKVQEWLESLYTPTMDNVNAWREFGVNVGRVAAFLAVVAGFAGAATVFTQLSRTLWTLSGGITGFLTAIAPLVIGLAVLGGAVYLVKQAFEQDWLGFGTYLRENAPQLAYVLDNLETILLRFKDNLLNVGIAAAFATLFNDLFGLSLGEFFQRLKNNIDTLGVAVRQFTRNARVDGWSSATQQLLIDVFGDTTATKILSGITRVVGIIVGFVVSVSNYISGIPERIRENGWRQTMLEVFRDGLVNPFLNTVAWFSDAIPTFVSWVDQQLTDISIAGGWNEQYEAIKAGFSNFASEVERRWESLSNLFGRVWNDLRTKVGWETFYHTAVGFLGAVFLASQRIWDELIASLTAAWDSFVNNIDWEQIKNLIDDISASLSSFGEGDTWNWKFFWDTVTHSINLTVAALQSVVDLLQLLFAPYPSNSAVEKTQDLGASLKNVANLAISNPFAGLLTAGLFAKMLSSLRTLTRRSWLLRTALDAVKFSFRAVRFIIRGVVRGFSRLSDAAFYVRYYLWSLKEYVTSKLGPALRSLRSVISRNAVRIFNRLREVVGDKVMPALRSFGRFLRQRALPALRTLGRIVSKNILPVLRTLASYLSKTLLPGIWTFAKGAAAAFFMAFGWVGVIIAAVSLVVAGAVWAWQTNFMGFRDFVTETAEKIKTKLLNAFDSVNEWFKNKKNRFSEFFRNEFNSIIRLYNKLPWVEDIPLLGEEPTISVPDTEDIEVQPSIQASSAPIIETPAPELTLPPSTVVPTIELFSPPSMPADISVSPEINTAPPILKIPTISEHREGVQPIVTVRNESKELQEELTRAMIPYYDAMRLPSSPGGEAITAQEHQMLRQVVEQLLVQLKEGIHVTTTTYLDGREISRSVEERQRRVQQRGSGGR